jgi:pilus assembly protein CpaB
MKTSRYVVIGIAALAAILLAFMVRTLMAPKPAATPVAVQAAPAPQATVRVLVVTRNIKAGEHLAEGDLNWADWPANLVNAAYIVDGPNGANGAKAASGSEDAATHNGAKTTTQQAGAQVEKASTKVGQVANDLMGGSAKTTYVGGVAREDMLANEPVIATKIVRADEGGFMAVMLNPGMRAVSVPVSVDTTAGGFILPGDRVDVLVTHQTQIPGGSGTVDNVQPVLRNIRILAIDQTVQTDKDKPSLIGATATVEVSPTDGQALVLAKASGTLSLMLRSYADAQGPSGLAGSAPISGGNDSVRVFRNGQSSDVLVSR